MTDTATALVQTGAGALEFRELPRPVLQEGAALLRVEANGICATDPEAYADELLGHTLPRINGHEIVGVIEELGPRSDGSSELRVGDRVAVNPYLSCGRCAACRRQQPNLCQGYAFSPACYGFIPVTHESGLWGGYSTHVYLHPWATVYPFSAGTDPLDATFWNPLAGGIQWAVTNTGTTIGTSIAILGCGQRGLSSVIAAHMAGAGPILVTGLARDRHKLDLALELGADVAVDVENDDLIDRARELTGGKGFDVVVDTTPGATQPLLDAIEIARSGGVISEIGVKSRTIPDFPVDTLVTKNLQIIGSVGASDAAQRYAAKIIDDGRVPTHRLRSRVFGFDQLPTAFDTLAGVDPTRRAINVVVTPDFTDNPDIAH